MVPSSKSVSGSLEADHASWADRIIGSGEVADLVRSYDSGTTALGSIENWSIELLTIVNLTLSSQTPARTMWALTSFSFITMHIAPSRARHPSALGKSARDVYTESWDTVGPLLEKAFATGETFFYERLLVPLPSDQGLRDSYLNYSFNPIYEKGEIAGLFGPLHELPEK